MSVFAASIPEAPVFHSRSRRSHAAALLLPLALAVGGCSATSADEPDPDAASAAADDAFPVTVTGDNGEVTLDEQPERIVSLSASATEMLFAIGAGPQVEAVDAYSNYPEDAPVTDLSSFEPNAEAIAGYEPDLVVLSDDMNGIVDALGALQVPTLQLGWTDSLDESYEQMETLGAATGHGDDAAKLVEDVQSRIEAAVASVPDDVEGLSVYHEIDPTYYALTSDTFVGDIYDRFGLENIADAAETPGETTQLSAEFIVSAAPEVVVLADTVCCDQSAQTFAQRPGFDIIPAVQDGRVLEVDDDIASRWGPRLADFAESVAETLNG